MARYYLPRGRTIQAVGVTPDITIPLGKIDFAEDTVMLKEKDLKKHLESELAKIDTETKKSTKKNEENNATKEDEKIITEEQIFKDLQLKSAVDILKALIITNKGKV